MLYSFGYVLYSDGIVLCSGVFWLRWCLNCVRCVIRCCSLLKFFDGVSRNRIVYRLVFLGMMLCLCR